MMNNRGGSRMDAFIKIILVGFVSLLSFSVGTYVGKQVSDSDNRKAKVEGEYNEVAKHDEGGHAEEGHGEAGQDAHGATDEKLSDEEIASLTDEFVNKEKTEAEQGEAHEEPARQVAATTHEDNSGYKKFKNNKGGHDAEAAPAAHGETAEHAADPHKKPAAPEAPAAEHSPAPQGKPHAAKPSPAAQRVAAGQAPAPDMAEPRKPQSVLPTIAASAVGKFTVQVASYPDETQARDHAATLKSSGWNAFYIPADIQGKKWFRVSVGLFTSAKSAGEFRTDFMKESKVQTAIVQKIVN